MDLVIDASVTVAWYFDDESTPVTEAVLDRVSQTGAIVSALRRLDVANAFLSAVRRKRITTGYRDHALAELMKMPITIDTETNAYAWTTTLQLSERYSLTAYDSAYLELARRHSHSLATLSNNTRRAIAERSGFAWFATVGLANHPRSRTPSVKLQSLSLWQEQVGWLRVGLLLSFLPLLLSPKA